MVDQIAVQDRQQSSIWPTRILWAGIGSVGITAIFSGSMIFSQWGVDLAGDVIDAIQMVTAVGLLVAAAWAGSVGVQTMQASRASSEAAVKANHQTSVDSHNATRPYVDARIVEGLAGTTEFDIVIRNVGKSAARDLTIGCEANVDRDDDVTRGVLELFSTQRILFPDTSLRSMWQIGEASKNPRTKSTDSRGDPVIGKMGMPDSAVLSLTYKSADGHHVYTDDIGVRCDKSGLWPVPEQGSMPEENARVDLQHVHSTLRAIARHAGDSNR